MLCLHTVVTEQDSTLLFPEDLCKNPAHCVVFSEGRRASSPPPAAHFKLLQNLRSAADEERKRVPSRRLREFCIVYRALRNVVAPFIDAVNILSCPRHRNTNSQLFPPNRPEN